MSIVDVYKKWRKKMLSASKYDVSLGFESLKSQLSALSERTDDGKLRFSNLEMGIESLKKQLSEISERTDDSTLCFSNLEMGFESLKKQLSEFYERKDDSTLRFSELEIAHHVPEPDNVSHSKWCSYLSDRFNKPGFRVLEIGSRVVTGMNLRQLFSEAEYVGFDFYEGNNVDMVGDAHRLSSYFNNDDKFNLIFSSAVFEHFHMPWVVAKEIHKLLAVGGHVFVETHFSYSAHERPWNFFQFSDMGFRRFSTAGWALRSLKKG